MPIKPFLVISMELIWEFCMDPQSQFWASVASIKILDGSQIVILKSGMLPFPSVVLIDSSFLVKFLRLGKFLGARHLSAFFRALTDLHTTRLFHSTRS